MAEEILISVGIETTHTELENVKSFMTEWIKENESREIVPSVLIYTVELFDSRRMDLAVVMSHKVFTITLIKGKSSRWRRTCCA
jgi:hypothetical protein